MELKNDLNESVKSSEATGSSDTNKISKSNVDKIDTTLINLSLHSALEGYDIAISLLEKDGNNSDAVKLLKSKRQDLEYELEIDLKDRLNK